MDRWFFGDEENSEARVGHLFASFNFDKKEYSSWRAEAGGSYG